MSQVEKHLTAAQMIGKLADLQGRLLAIQAILTAHQRIANADLTAVVNNAADAIHDRALHVAVEIQKANASSAFGLDASDAAHELRLEVEGAEFILHAAGRAPEPDRPALLRAAAAAVAEARKHASAAEHALRTPRLVAGTDALARQQPHG